MFVNICLTWYTSVAVSLALFQTEDPSWALSSPETLELVKVGHKAIFLLSLKVGVASPEG